MNRKRTALVDRLESSGKEFVRYLSQLSDEEVHSAPEPHEWTIHQVVAHIRDAEQQVFLMRAQRLLTEQHPAVQNFDQEEWNRDHYAASEPFKKIVAEFRASRREFIRLLRKAADEDWTNWALHPEYGKISLDWLAMHNFHHTLEHTAQIGYACEKLILKTLNE